MKKIFTYILCFSTLHLFGVTQQEMETIRTVIAAKTHLELQTAEDCLEKINGKMANLFYWCFKTKEELNSMSLGRHIFLSLHLGELERLLAIKDGLDNKLIESIASRAEIYQYRTDILATMKGFSLDAFSTAERASFAQALTKQYKETDEFCAREDIVCSSETDEHDHSY